MGCGAIATHHKDNGILHKASLREKLSRASVDDKSC